jgi:hypothetical protein
MFVFLLSVLALLMFRLWFRLWLMLWLRVRIWDEQRMRIKGGSALCDIVDAFLWGGCVLVFVDVFAWICALTLAKGLDMHRWASAVLHAR